MHPQSSQLILISLLVKLGVAAAVSSSLSRSVLFERLLLAPHRTTKQRTQLVALICAPLVLGVWIRGVVPNFLAADISFELTVLLGVLLGPAAALLGGILLAVPALLHHEYLALPVNVALALIFGAFHRFATAEQIWSFSPMIDLSLYHWVTRNLKRPHVDRQILLLVTISATNLGLSVLSGLYPKRYFALRTNNWAVELAICACAPVVVGVPLKVWNSLRMERKLEEQQRLLVEARLDALTRQINPHFLFNTLNSIASLIRRNPDGAREMVVKLANILRILLKQRDAFVPFSEEMRFTDDYLAIEVVRFGENLRVVKEIAPETLNIVVPSMLLQPLIENSIKHGLEPRIHGGTVTLRSRLQNGKLLIDLEDDGVGMSPDRQVRVGGGGVERGGTGIGMKNVRERMEVLYGDDAVMEVVSRPGRGTRITLEMPALEGAPGSK